MQDKMTLVTVGTNPAAKVIVTAENYKGLSDVVLFLKKKNVPAVLFSQTVIDVLSPDNYGLLVPTNDMLPHLLKAIQTAKKQGLAYYLENLPLCLLPGEEDHFIDGGAGIKMQFCTSCELNPRCGGITKAQLIAQYGTQLLSWQFLFPRNFFTEQDIAFLDEQLLKSANKV